MASIAPIKMNYERHLRAIAFRVGPMNWILLRSSLFSRPTGQVKHRYCISIEIHWFL